MSVNIVVDTFDSAITVPRAAIIDLDGDPHVLLDKDGTATETPVTVRRWPSERLVVTEGLSEGDKLITKPQNVSAGDLVSAETGG